MSCLFHGSYSGTNATMQGILDPSTEQLYTGHILQPEMGQTGTLGGTDADYYEEPPLLEGKLSLKLEACLPACLIQIDN